ncbi:hypothetical protein I4U23_010933 [Adineta vaga]|nr:hypothetical protein I4U23_010933 [Adineta vaga]
MSNYNLFMLEENDYEDDDDRLQDPATVLKQQKYKTWLYVVLLAVCLYILFYGTLIKAESKTEIISNITPAIFDQLYAEHVETLSCPCSTITIPYENFVSNNVTMHPVCSSVFVSKEWIEGLYIENATHYETWDFRKVAYSQFELLSKLCLLSREIISQIQTDVNNTEFLTINLLPRMPIQLEIDVTIESQKNNAFDRMISFLNYWEITIKRNNLISALGTNFLMLIGYDTDVPIVCGFPALYNNTDLFTLQPCGVSSSAKDPINAAFLSPQPMDLNHVALQLFLKTRPNATIVNGFFVACTVLDALLASTLDCLMVEKRVLRILGFVLYRVEDINSELTTCICAINPYCQRPAVITSFDPAIDTNNPSDAIHNISGWVHGCLATDSISLSTLQCLYVDSDCFPLLLTYMGKDNTDVLSLPSSSFRLRPLVYDPTLSRYPPNTLISTIIKELMLEKWNLVSSYEQFYESCTPIYCTYSESIRKQTFLGLIITLVSMIGGIVVSLRILTPHLVKMFLGLLAKFNKKSNKNEQVRHGFAYRLKMMIQNTIKMLRTTLTDLNIFMLRDFGSDLDRVTAKRYGRWATRLYFILFITSFTILILYTIIQPNILTKKFDKPSFTYYNRLRQIYGDDLKCSCSRIASTYNQSVNIQPIFHSICLSEFVSEEWRVSLINGLLSNLTIYDQRDYRRFLSAHLQYLQGLCRLSIQAANNSINEFLTSLLVTSEIFVIHGNAFVTTYGTNFEYVEMTHGKIASIAPAEPIIYDDNCSCRFSPNCTIQAAFIETNSSKEIFIKGMKMGCTPSETLFASTLECFYDQSCLDHIQQYTNYNNSLTSLPTTSSRFSKNTTIDELRLSLFIEDWSTQMNYSSYYEQCLPLVCLYTSIKKFNIVYTITLILGLQGGLTIVLKWICPKLVQIGSSIYQKRKKRFTPVHPIISTELPASVTTNRIIRHTTWNYENTPMNLTIP